MLGEIKSLKAYPKLAFYIILLLLVMILASAMLASRISSSAIKRETEHANLLFLNKLNKIVENEILHMNNTLARFCHENLYDNQINLKMEDPYEHYKVFVNINDLLENNRYIHSVNVFYNQGEDVFFQSYNQSGSMKTEDFYDIDAYRSFIRESNLSAVTGTRLIKPDYTGTGSKEQNHTRVFSFIKRIPANLLNAKDAVVFNIHSDYLGKLAESSLIPEESRILVFDIEGEILISYDQQTDSPVKLEAGSIAALKSGLKGSTSGKSYGMQYENESCYVTDIKSDTGKRYVLIIPEDVMFRQVNVMNRTLFYFSAVLLLLGVLFSAFIDKKFFQPVLSILHNLNTGRAEVTVAADLNDRAPDSKVKASEFVQIETYINTMISKNRDQEKQLESYFQYYRERIIQALMNNDRQAVEMLEDDRILFNRNYKYFSLILICSGVHEPDGTGTDQEQSAMEHFNCNLTGVLSGLGQLEKITITRQKTALLLCMESERTVCDIARHIRENLQNRLEASDISITVGCVCNSMRHIGKSYTNAEELMKYCHEEQGLHVIDGSMSGDVPGSRDYRCTEKTVMGIAEALKQQDSLRLEEHLGYFFEQMRVNGVSLKSMKKKCLVLIYRIFTEAGEDIRESKNELFLENIFDKLEGLRSVHGLEEWTKESFMNCIANPASTSDGINNRDLIDRVVKFIDLHYMEDIGLNTIADYVYFSPSYLGKVFKEVSGYNFSDYIIKVRMEKAAKLILDSNTKLTDIMEKVGYYSIQGFSRVFKSYFKCSPGEYRKKYACDVLKTENVR